MQESETREGEEMGILNFELFFLRKKLHCGGGDLEVAIGPCGLLF